MAVGTAEEEGLIGSTEWGEQNAEALTHAVAYFNMDVGVSGPKFGASSVPSLKQFVRDVTKAVASPQGGTVYDVWRKAGQAGTEPVSPQETAGSTFRAPVVQGRPTRRSGNWGAVPTTPCFSSISACLPRTSGPRGAYGVYHSAFDNFNWFKKFGDPDFVYEQQMARVFGLEAVRMASMDVLPYDYEEYGKEISAYIGAAREKGGRQVFRPSFGFLGGCGGSQAFSGSGSKNSGQAEEPAFRAIWKG